MKKSIRNNIFKSFEVFLREPLSILRQSFVQIVNVQTNIFAQKSAVNVDFLDKKTQITVVNNEKVYSLLQTVLYKQKMKEREHENAR